MTYYFNQYVVKFIIIKIIIEQNTAVIIYFVLNNFLILVYNSLYSIFF